MLHNYIWMSGRCGHVAIHPRAGTYMAMVSCWLRRGGWERAWKVVLDRPKDDGAAAMVFYVFYEICGHGHGHLHIILV